ncbi:hypothetical protein ABK040_013630 [Willaertia magna]
MFPPQAPPTELLDPYFNNGLDILSVFSSIKLPSITTIIIYITMLIYSVIATIIIPGKRKPGATLKNNTVIHYKLNGLNVVLLSILIFTILCYLPLNISTTNPTNNTISVPIYTYITHHIGELIITTLIFSLFFCTFLFLRATFYIPKDQQNYQYPPTLFNFIKNYWCGVELNPHIYGFEIKLFSYRPAFILLSMINISFIFEQYSLYQTLSLNLVTFEFISFWYIIDAFVFEYGLVFMFDIIEENFGFMLLMGDYTWIPMVFSVQNLYLINDFGVNWYQTIGNLILFLLGFIIFRGANNQKFVFRQDPTKTWFGIKPVTIETAGNRKLLISGFWGIARKVNYLGDILVAISQSLPCLQCGYLLPWAYPIYLTLLLLNRAQRDNERCQAKYGKFWDEYCSRVKYIMIPGIF